ncbi:hypothetical protein M404DRAFT_302045 [Pisolithus tinctorius Marx 270]|uniref:Uncharacterized protein n=1 Tax=Pisolithus tinctorius Marx 270 TaxID=870435 RepID=A0A0C3KH93_PISTI|nr:hypothetical protein M404DRAFT_302045 [Pisolithus tinctorius Marx 270]
MLVGSGFRVIHKPGVRSTCVLESMSCPTGVFDTKGMKGGSKMRGWRLLSEGNKKPQLDMSAYRQWGFPPPSTSFRTLLDGDPTSRYCLCDPCILWTCLNFALIDRMRFV